MTEAARRPDCLDANMMAEYIDGGLEPRQRAEVEAHLAECEECYENFSETVKVSGGIAAAAAAIPMRSVSRRRSWKAIAAFTTAAAALVIWAANPAQLYKRWSLSRSMSTLVAAVGSDRFSEGRVSDPFQFGQAPSPTRGGERTVRADVQIAALEVLRRTGGLDTADALRKAAIAQLVLGRPREAVSTLEAAVEKAPADARLHVDLSAALIELFRTTGDTQDAVRAWDEARVARQVDPRSPTALFNSALAAELVGQTSEAMERWEEFIRADPNSPWAPEAQSRLTRLRGMKSPQAVNPVAGAARATFEQAPHAAYVWLETSFFPRWASAAQDGSPVDVAEAGEIAAQLQRQGRDRYAAILTSAAAASASWPAPRRLALARGTQSLLQWRDAIDAGEYPKAEELAKQAYGSLNDAGIDAAEAEFELAYSMLASGRNREAKPRLDSLVTRSRQLGFNRVAANTLRLVGFLAMAEGRLSDAHSAYDAGLELAERSGDYELQALLHTFVGECFKVVGDERSEWHHLGIALGLLPQSRAIRRHYEVLRNASTAAAALGLDHAAAGFAEAMIRDTASWRNPEGQLVGHLYRAEALSSLGRPDEVRRDLDAAAESLPRLADRPAAQRQMTAEIATARAIALTGIDDAAALANSDTAIAFFRNGLALRMVAIQLQRGRILKNLGRSDDARKAWLEGSALLESQRPEIRSEILRVSRADQMWDLYSELIKSYLPDPVQSLQVSDRAHSFELTQSLHSDLAKPLSADFVQTALGSDTTVLAYSVMDDQLVAWRINRGRIVVSQQRIAKTDVHRLVNDYLRNVDREETNAALSRVLFPWPDTAWAPPKLVIIPDGVLAAVPFSALRLPGSRRRIAETHLVTVAPSIASLLGSQPRGTVSSVTRSLLSVGTDAAIPEMRFRQLPNAEREAHLIAAKYKRSLALTGQQASRAAVLRELPKFSMIHIAGHAYADVEFPNRSFIALAGGDRLSGDDLAGLRLQPGTIATLAACDTAVGRSYRGEGPMSLVRSVLRSGAFGAVATLWEVRDDDSTALFSDLHTLLAGGGTLPESLASVQRKFIAAGWPPSRWAGFESFSGMSLSGGY